MTRMTFSEVRADKLTVVGDDVYDLSRFAAKHPGTSEIGQLRGMDATLPMVNAHGVKGALGPLPKKFKVGEIDESTLEPADRELRQMWRDYQARGLFVYKRRWLMVDIARGLGLFAAAALSLQLSSLLAFVLFTVAILNVMWWVHDACHDSVFATRKMAKRWAEAASMIFVGTPVLDYQYVVHRLHHGFTNVIGADQALETGPVVWDDRMRARSVDGLVALQAWLWFTVVLPLTFPLFLVMAVHGQIKKRNFISLALTALRWGLAAVLFHNHLALLVLPVLAAGYLLALTSSLNHFHKPMSETLDPSFARSVTEVTQNLVHTSPLITWLSGGLNFHIEHHFFATMPRHNYRVIAPEIRAFCARHHLAYSTCTLPEAIAALWNKLQSPYALVEAVSVA
jgi:fatty acid desaturase 3 (Delta-13 desaturase)